MNVNYKPQGMHRQCNLDFFLMSKIIVFSLFHRQNFVVPTEHAKEIKYIDARS